MRREERRESRARPRRRRCNVPGTAREEVRDETEPRSGPCLCFKMAARRTGFDSPPARPSRPRRITRRQRRHSKLPRGYGEIRDVLRSTANGIRRASSRSSSRNSRPVGIATVGNGRRAAETGESYGDSTSSPLARRRREQLTRLRSFCPIFRVFSQNGYPSDGGECR